MRVSARDPVPNRWSWSTRLLVPLLTVLVAVALLATDYRQAQVYALVAFVVLLAEDTARLRARVRALEETVEELIET